MVQLSTVRAAAYPRIAQVYAAAIVAGARGSTEARSQNGPAADGSIEQPDHASYSVQVTVPDQAGMHLGAKGPYKFTCEHLYATRTNRTTDVIQNQANFNAPRYARRRQIRAPSYKA